MNNQVLKDPIRGSSRFAVAEGAIDQFRRTAPYVRLCLESFNYQLDGVFGTPAPKLTMGTMVISKPPQHGAPLMEAPGDVFLKGNNSAIVGEGRKMTHPFMASSLFKVFAPIGKIRTANAWKKSTKANHLAMCRSTVSGSSFFPATCIRSTTK